MTKPICVCTSDIHFNLNNLELSTAALKAALSKAESLQVPLVIAGDLHDHKAIIRAEVMNRLLEVIRGAETKVYILVGNHDLINEKGEGHGLNYLKPYAKIIDFPQIEVINNCSLGLIPYSQNFELDLEEVSLNCGGLIICHQGFLGAAMGDYIQDKTSIDPELVKDFTVISGHYHRHQTIGTVTYIGSPFTMSFGEANDGLKGFLILNSDGTYTREILNLRKHIKLELTVDELRIWLNSSMYDTCKYDSSDLVWLKVSGPYSEIQHLNKQQIANRLGLVSFKLDLIPTDSKPTDIQVENLSSSEVFDTLIDNTSESDEQKTNLKAIWRELI